MRAAVAALMVFLAAPPALAQPPVAPVADAIEPARLAAARKVVEKVFPLGTYKRMMSGTMQTLMDSMMGGAMDMPIGPIAAMGGLETDQVKALGDAKLSDIMKIYDPYYRERTQLGMRAMMDAMGSMMSEFEPRMQAGLTRAYARKFTPAQLGELDAFFATPTGSIYAAESMTLYMDPEVMREMQTLVPDLMKHMPDLIKANSEATKHLPPPRKPDALSEAEKDRLAKLLGVKKSELRDPPTQEPVS